MSKVHFKWFLTVRLDEHQIKYQQPYFWNQTHDKKINSCSDLITYFCLDTSFNNKDFIITIMNLDMVFDWQSILRIVYKTILTFVFYRVSHHFRLVPLLNIMALYMSFDKFVLAVESRDLSQADKSIILVSSFPKLLLNDKIYSYTKKTIWHLAIWQNWCFGQFYDSKICKIEK